VIDIVTVSHNAKNEALARRLGNVLRSHSDCHYNFVTVNNRVHNVGFGPACNLGARHGICPIVGFLNPDVEVSGEFSHLVCEAFEDPEVVIAGENFGKPEWEYNLWGCADWVCGAAFFVRRGWFEVVGGFDERYKWSWEETDLIRLAQEQGKKVKSIELPISHASPTGDNHADRLYKSTHFEQGKKLFDAKWGPQPRFRRARASATRI
jgi:GT2 family glycosyltransferase